MSLSTGKEILAYFGMVRNDRHLFETKWQDIADSIRGRTDFLSDDTTPAQDTNALIYDSTGQLAASQLASAFHNFLTNTSTTWFMLAPEDDRLMEMDGVGLWFEEASRRVRSSFDAPESNFIPAMHEFYKDLVDFGTASVFVSDVAGPSPVRFRSNPLPEVFALENASGRIDTVFRRFRLTNRQAVDEYGDAAKKATQQLERNPFGRMLYVQIIHRRNDPMQARRPLGGNFDWRAATVCTEDETIVEDKGFHELAHLVARFEKESGEVYGRGPGWQALPVQKMLNTMKKETLTGAQMKVRPPIIAPDDGVIWPIKLRPAGITKVRMSSFLGRTEPIQTLDVGGDIGIGIEMMNAERQSVRSAYLSEVLEILQQNFQTARQVIEIVERAQALLSPQIGRLQIEVLEPMLERVYGINARAGRLPIAPPAIQGAPLKVTFVSPVQRAQRFGEVRAMAEALTMIGEFAQLDQTMLDHVDFDKVPAEIIRNTGTTLKILRGSRDVKRIREARSQVLAEQQQRQDAALAAQVAGQVGPAMQQQQGMSPAGEA